MVVRWGVTALIDAQTRFRRIRGYRGYRELPELDAALRNLIKPEVNKQAISA